MAMWKGKHFHTVLTEQSKCSKDIKMNNIILVYLRVVWLTFWPHNNKGAGSSPPYRLQSFQLQILNISKKSSAWRYSVYYIPFHIQSCWPLTLKSNRVTYSLRSLTLIGLLDIDWASLGLLVINVWRSLTYDLVTLKYMYIGVMDGTTVQSVDYT